MLPTVNVTNPKQHQNRHNKISGFTLIEILVVVVIIAIMTALAAIRFSGFGSVRAMKRTLMQMQSLFPVVQTRAILQPAILGIKLEKSQFTILQLNQDSTDKNSLKWLPIKHGHLAGEHKFPRGVTISVATGHEIKDTTQVLTYGSYLPKQKPTKTDTNLIDNTKQNQRPQIIFLPNGNVTATKLLINGSHGLNPIPLTVTSGGNLIIKHAPQKAKTNENKTQ